MKWNDYESSYRFIKGLPRFRPFHFQGQFFNSFYLAKNLINQATYCTGTLYEKRKYVCVVEKKFKKEEWLARYANNVLVVKWKDKRDVLFISTEHSAELIKETAIEKHCQQFFNIIYIWAVLIGKTNYISITPANVKMVYKIGDPLSSTDATKCIFQIAKFPLMNSQICSFAAFCKYR